MLLSGNMFRMPRSLRRAFYAIIYVALALT